MKFYKDLWEFQEIFGKNYQYVVWVKDTTDKIRLNGEDSHLNDYSLIKIWVFFDCFFKDKINGINPIYQSIFMNKY